MVINYCQKLYLLPVDLNVELIFLGILFVKWNFANSTRTLSLSLSLFGKGKRTPWWDWFWDLVSVCMVGICEHSFLNTFS